MKIGIITFWQSRNNYGQILQLYAMQQILIKLGHSPFLIKYHRVPSKKQESLVRRFLPSKILNFLKKYLVQENRENKDEYRRFDDFKKENILFGDKDYFSFQQLVEEAPIADAYIVGSDQVWNNKFFVSAEAFLLGYGSKNIIRIAYAASFGQRQLDAETRKLFLKYIKAFKAIGVREKSGVSICSDLGEERAQWVLDPTLLFDRNEWMGLIKEEEKSESKTIFIYTLGNSNIVDKELFLDYAKSLDEYKILHATANDDSSGSFWPTIPQWVNSIRSADLVITTSFHGMVFCIINNTNFIILPNTGHAEGMNERITSLLEMLDLEEHLMSHFSKEKFESIKNKEMPWENINLILEKRRQESLIFLKNSLVK